jgi:hypothetical protein
MTLAPGVPPPEALASGREPADDEARRIARHLVGEDPTPEEAARWAHALEVAALPLEHERDRRLWALVRRSPAWLGIVDAGLALVDPWSPVRQRLCLMLAVLEASPAHTHRFLPARWGAGGWVTLAARAALGVTRAALGVALVRSWGTLWR